MLTRRHLLSICALALVACHSSAAPTGAPPERRAAAALTGALCPSEVPEAAGEAWREVGSASFTFCVPPDWTPRNARSGHAWSGEGVDLQWTTSRAQETTTRTERIAVQPGESVDMAIERMKMESRQELRETDEVIGGRLARLSHNHIQGTYYASARWETPSLQFTATARTLQGASRAMQIYRTVRFAGGRD